MRPTVYAVQNTLTRDTNGDLVPKHDLSPAAEHGPVVVLLGPSAAPWSQEVTREMARKLEGFTEQDYLLPVGNPILIGVAYALAAEQSGGRVKVLQWDGRRRAYNVVQTDLEWPEDAE